ncbi:MULTISPECIES: hypothetical protein [unclassified Cupriavidus]|uniref:hypothetical protein n=1 Tax=unclassified Cupriavidus TaxID=2640874 RepID=UPI001366178E|nr:hypothetical protein [Cupriavidus sp. SW-Y-13]MWL89374.1 hypothetical protein [Cupriavidus sp. SW-Y-13]
MSKPRPAIVPAAGTESRSRDFQDTAGSYDRVFARVMATVEGISEAESQEILAFVKSSGSDGLNLAGYFEQVYARYFKGRAWTWTEYDDWARIFAQMGQFPSTWTDIDKPRKPKTRAEELLGQRTADIRAFLDAEGVQYLPTAKKEQLVAIVELTPALADSALWQAVLAKRREEADAALERRPRLLYDLLMRTIAYRAKSERELQRAKAAGVKRFDVMLAIEADRKFVEIARQKDPQAVPPFYPNDFTLLRPIIDNNNTGR